MKRSQFFKSLVGLVAVASNPSVLTKLSNAVPKKAVKKVATMGTINKCYVSAIDPILDTREINKLIDVYGDESFLDIINTPLKIK